MNTMIKSVMLVLLLAVGASAELTGCLFGTIQSNGYPKGCDCPTITGATASQQNWPYNICDSGCGKYKGDLPTFRACLEYVRLYKNDNAALSQISDPVYGGGQNVLGALLCDALQALANKISACGWVCNNFYLRGDAYAKSILKGQVASTCVHIPV